MKRTIIDPSQLGELEDNVVTIKRVTRVIRCRRCGYRSGLKKESF